MNHFRVGLATLFTATTLVGTLSACSTPTVPRPHDKLDDWVTTQSQPSNPSGWRLGVEKLYEVKPSLQKGYYGVGTLGDRCLVSFTTPHVGDKPASISEGKMEIKVFSRKGDDISLSPGHPLPLDDSNEKNTVAYWVSSQYLGCVTQSIA